MKARYDAAPEKSRTLESLVENEKGEKKRTATEGLLWLLRGLAFTCKALQNAQSNKSEELSVAFNKSYDGTLKKFHNFVVKGIFSVCLSLTSEGMGIHFFLQTGRYEGLSLPRRFLHQTAHR